jgi:hypothetical protein
LLCERCQEKEKTSPQSVTEYLQRHLIRNSYSKYTKNPYNSTMIQQPDFKNGQKTCTNISSKKKIRQLQVTTRKDTHHMSLGYDKLVQCHTTTHLLGWTEFKTLKTLNVVKDVERQDCDSLFIRVQKGAATWKAVWLFLTKLNINLLYGSLIKLLIYPKIWKFMF